MARLTKEFFTQNALELAPMLIGKLLFRKIGKEIIKLRITETESYYGTEDTACHAHKGKTERTEPMFSEGGITYIYLCYGMYNMLNIVSGKKDNPEAVLIRGVEGFNGPGKLTKALNITRDLNTIDLCKSKELWIEDDGIILEYKTTPRIGISYASQEYRNKEWRFVVKN
ncbi:MAG: DNA-3-methyladenine glycosylase [Bacteroidales bacterium]|jgi:DNA-3-methyladenine glycosylase